MNSLNLGGHSGCGVFLMETENGQMFVRKTSKDPAYNERLKAQCTKQKNFQGHNLKTPAVLQEGVDKNGCFYFDMEYVQGVTLAEYIKTMEIGKIRGLVHILVEDLMPKTISADPQLAEQAHLCFAEKLTSLIPQVKNHPQAAKALQLLQDHNWKAFTSSFCHGDLTLENIIVRNDTLYLIDFLDSFYDSWLLDMGTLLQDVQTMWAYRNKTPLTANAMLRLMVFRDLLIDTVVATNPCYVKEIYYALLMKLVRIYPYTTDAATIAFLNEKLVWLITWLNNQGKGGNL